MIYLFDMPCKVSLQRDEHWHHWRSISLILATISLFSDLTNLALLGKWHYCYSGWWWSLIWLLERVKRVKNSRENNIAAWSIEKICSIPQCRSAPNTDEGSFVLSILSYLWLPNLPPSSVCLLPISIPHIGKLQSKVKITVCKILH